MFGVENIVSHHKLTSSEFFPRFNALGLPPIDIAFVDGNHSYDHVRHDFMAVLRQSRKNAYIFLHDTNIFIREFVRNAGVKRWLRNVKAHTDLFEAVDFPFSSGVAIVRVLKDNSWHLLNSYH
jgi:hypothetical protein